MPASVKNPKKWQTGHILENLDGFGEPVPAFNVKGQSTIRTRCGGVTTLIIATTVLLYAVIKFNHLSTRHNPHMSSYLQDIPQKESVDISDDSYKFKIALSIEDFIDSNEMKNDPKYTKWLFRLYTKENGVASHRELATHRCTE